MAEVKVRPRVDIEPSGLLLPSAGLSEAAEQLTSFLREQFSHTMPAKGASSRRNRQGVSPRCPQR